MTLDRRDDWQERVAPTLAEIENLAARAWRAMPAEFRDKCESIVVRVEEFATDEVLAAVGLEDPFDLMGLYHGVSLEQKSVMHAPRGPDLVVLYRRAILDYWAEGTETLGHLVTHVLVHEIGHHFGLSDASMAAIEAEVAR